MREKVQRQHILAATQSDQVFFKSLGLLKDEESSSATLCLL